MTSRRSRAAVAAALGIAILLLTGCDLGHPGGFTARSESYCRETSTQIGKLARPTTPKAQLQYATDRYTLIERLVSELTDSPLPAGTDGTKFRDHWLRPARASLVDGRTVLADLRSAVNSDDAEAANAEFARSLAIGTGGVDSTLLSQHSLPNCADTFTPSAV